MNTHDTHRYTLSLFCVNETAIELSGTPYTATVNTQPSLRSVQRNNLKKSDSRRVI